MMRGLLHELRNPLSSIITAATLLQDSSQPDALITGDETRLLLDVVKKESLRLNHILTKFADYIKLPAPQPGAFDLMAATRAVIGELRRQGVLTPEIEIDDRLPQTASVWADEALIRQALHYLLTNAAEAMPGGGCLLLTSSPGESDQELTFCISDNGRGFSEESRARAFQVFFSTKAHHLGLGLPMAKSIIELCEGRIWLNSNTAPGPSSRNLSTPAGAQICFALPHAS